MRLQLETIHRHLVALENYVAQSGVWINLKKVGADVGALREFTIELIQTLGDGPPTREIKQIATTDNTVTALCEDGSLWCYDQSAEWKLYPGIPAEVKDESVQEQVRDQ